MEELGGSIESTCQWYSANGLAGANRLALTTTIRLRDADRSRGSWAARFMQNIKRWRCFKSSFAAEFFCKRSFGTRFALWMLVFVCPAEYYAVEIAVDQISKELSRLFFYAFFPG
jgi:hypothetical protein